MKTTLLIAGAIIITIGISWCVTADPGVLPGTKNIEYNGFKEYVTFPGEVDLEYVYSSLPLGYLEVETNGFNPIDNETQYSFRSIEYIPEYWEQDLNDEWYIYQDTLTKKLFIVIVNLSSVEIPEDPWKIDFLLLADEYNNISTNLTATWENLTQKEQQLNELLIAYNETCHQMDNISGENEELEEGLFDVTYQLHNAQQEVNKSKADLMDAMSNLTSFRRFYENMNGYDPNFYFRLGGEEQQYHSVYYYEQQLKDLNEQLGSIPVILLFAVLTTIVISLMIGYWKWARSRADPEEMEIFTGVDPETTLVNRFKSRLNILPVGLKKPQAAETKPLDPPSHPGPENNPFHAKEEHVEHIENNIDNTMIDRIDTIEQKYDDISDKLDQLLTQKNKTVKTT